MATLTIYQDKRSGTDEFPIKLIVRNRKTSVMVSLGISVSASNWDAKNCRVINAPNRIAQNSYIKQRYNEFERIMMELFVPDSQASARLIKQRVLEKIAAIGTNSGNSLVKLFSAFAESRNKQRTKELYRETLKKISAFEPCASEMILEDVNVDWLQRFDKHLSDTGLRTNTCSIHFRNIRAVIKEALAHGYISTNPFLRFKIRHEITMKRSLSVEQIRSILNYVYKPCKNTTYYGEYIAMIKLTIFFRGINIVDLLHLKKEDIVDGYIHYNREKTGRSYFIKIEPEARELLDRYKGKNYLLCPLDRYNNYRNYAAHLNDAIKHFGHDEQLTTYWFRHSWATICINVLHIPIEIVSAGLGHEFGNRTTAVYVNLDQREVDKAARRMIDYILYDKV